MSKPAANAAPELPEEVGVESLAAVLGITAHRVRQLVEEGAVKKTGHGRYRLGESVRGYLAFKLRAQADELERSTAGEDFEIHRARLYKARADAAEIDLALRMGEVIHGDIAEELFTDCIRKMRSKVLAMPTRLAPQLEGVCDIKAIYSLLREACHDTLTEVADYDPQPMIEEWLRREGKKAVRPEEKSKGNATGEADER